MVEKRPGPCGPGPGLKIMGQLRGDFTVGGHGCIDHSSFCRLVKDRWWRCINTRVYRMQNERQADASVVADRRISNPIVAVAHRSALTMLPAERNIIDGHILRAFRVFHGRADTWIRTFSHVDLDVFR